MCEIMKYFQINEIMNYAQYYVLLVQFCNVKKTY